MKIGGVWREKEREREDDEGCGTKRQALMKEMRTDIALFLFSRLFFSPPLFPPHLSANSPRARYGLSVNIFPAYFSIRAPLFAAMSHAARVCRYRSGGR